MISKHVVTFTQNLARLILIPFFFIVFRLKIAYTRPRWRKGPVIVASNHRTVFDPPLVGVLSFQTYFYMAKKELFKNPVAGAILKAVGSFPVNRAVFDMKSLTAMQQILQTHVTTPILKVVKVTSMVILSALKKRILQQHHLNGISIYLVLKQVWIRQLTFLI